MGNIIFNVNDTHFFEPAVRGGLSSRTVITKNIQSSISLQIGYPGKSFFEIYLILSQMVEGLNN